MKNAVSATVGHMNTYLLTFWEIKTGRKNFLSNALPAIFILHHSLSMLMLSVIASLFSPLSVSCLTAKEIPVFWKNLRHNQFWKKSTTVTIDWYNMLVEWTDLDYCRLSQNINRQERKKKENTHRRKFWIVLFRAERDMKPKYLKTWWWWWWILLCAHVLRA